MRAKICGITRPQDAVAAERAGVDAIGLMFVAHSKRRLTLAAAQEISAAVGPLMQRVGVFMNSPLDEVLAAARTLRLHAVQLHGAEDAAFVSALSKRVWTIKAFSFTPALSLETLSSCPADAVMLDGLRPGSGEAFAWEEAAFLRNYPHLILAGGLTPETVAAGVKALEPYAVDVSSGVEKAPGIKDPVKIQDFVRAARLG